MPLPHLQTTGHLCPMLLSRELATWVSPAPEKGDYSWTPCLNYSPHHTWMAKQTNVYFKSFAWWTPLCGCFQAMGPVTTHKLFQLISPFSINLDVAETEKWVDPASKLADHPQGQLLTKPEHHKFIHQGERKWLAEIQLSLPPLMKHCSDDWWNICKTEWGEYPCKRFPSFAGYDLTLFPPFRYVLWRKYAFGILSYLMVKRNQNLVQWV